MNGPTQGLAPSAAGEWRRHWPLVLAGFLGMSFYSIVTYTLGTFIAPLEGEFGWSRAKISAGLTVFTVAATLGGPMIGWVIDRVGTRRVAATGIALHTLAFAAFGFNTGSVALWFALWTVLALVALATKGLIWSAGVSSVFTKSRSLALSVMLSGSALGQASPKIADALIQSQGWRAAYVWLGLGWGGLATLMVLLFFHDARSLGARKTDQAAPAPARPLGGLTVREGLRDHRILRIALANVMMSAFGSGIAVHLVPILAEADGDRMFAVNMAASMGIAGLFSRIGVGWLLDRIEGGLLPFISYSSAALAYFLLLDTFDSRTALASGVLVLGLTGGVGFQISTYLVSRYAGLRNFGVLFGFISSAMMLGTSIGPLVYGWVHDVTGSYNAMLTAGIPVVLVCAALFLGLGPYPDYATPDAAEQP